MEKAEMTEKLEKAEEAKRILHVCIILHCSEWLREDVQDPSGFVLSPHLWYIRCGEKKKKKSWAGPLGAAVPVSLCGNSHSLLVISSSSSSVWLKEFKESDLDLWGDSFPTSVGCRKTVWTSWMWALSSSQDSARKSQPSHCSTSITEHSLENQGNLQRRENKIIN